MNKEPGIDTEIFYPSPTWNRRSERLIHVYTIDDEGNKTWFWMCSECGKTMAPHKMDVPHGVDGSWRVLQSKGAASRHLGSHDLRYVNHGRPIDEITRQGKTLCKKCGNIASNKKVGELFSYSLDKEEKYYCFDCGWLKKSDTTKIIIRKL